MPRASVDTRSEPRRVLTGAVLRASALLEITQSSLAQILGLSPSTVSRMANGAYTLDTQEKEWELGALFVRLFRSLDALIGSNDTAARAWLEGLNRGLARRPGQLICHKQGLGRTADRAHSQYRRLCPCRPISGRCARSNLRRGAQLAVCGEPWKPSISP